MRGFLPIPPPFLSATVCGLGGASVARRLAVSPSSVMQACGGTRRSLASAPFAACAPWFALVRACFSVGASLLALGRACGSRCLPFVRLGSCLLYVPCFVGRQQSCYRYCSINPSSSGCANPALNPAPFSRWTLRDKAAQRRLALR